MRFDKKRRTIGSNFISTLALMAILIPATASADDLEKRAWDVLTAGLSEGVNHRMQAIAALGAIGPNARVVQLLEWALSDPESSVREIAAATLGEIRATSAIPKLKQVLQDEHPEVSFATAKALWDMGDLSGRDIFLEILEGERSDTHEGIGGAVHEAKIKMRDKPGLAKTGAMEAAGFVLGPFALGLNVAEDLTKDSTASARAFSASLLGMDPDPRAAAALQKATQDKNWVVRAAATKALARRADPKLIPILRQLLDDERHAVQYMAAAAIIRSSSETATTSLPARQ